MERRNLNRIITLVLTAVIVLVALMLTGSLHRPASIILPAETAASEQPSGSPEDAAGALTQVAVTPVTVQTAIETLARPEQYRRTVSIQQMWDGGSGSWETTVTASQPWTRTDRTLTDGRIRHTVTDGESTYIWYNAETTVFTAPAGSITPDAEQSIPTYEDVLLLPTRDIVAADYRTIGEQVNCIYVETAEDAYGYSLRYWVSVDSGLLVAAEKLQRGETTYRMWETAIDLAPALTDEFTLPDGTKLSP